MTLTEGPTQLATQPLDLNGQTTFSISLPAGAHFLNAIYNDVASFVRKQSKVLELTGTKHSTTTTLLGTAIVGQPAVFTTTVASPGGTPTGTVTLLDDQAVRTTVTLDVLGVATLLTSTLSVGGHTITAVYSGETLYAGSTSAPLTELVINTTYGRNVTVDAGSGVAVTFAGVISWADCGRADRSRGPLRHRRPRSSQRSPRSTSRPQRSVVGPISICLTTLVGIDTTMFARFVLYGENGFLIDRTILRTASAWRNPAPASRALTLIRWSTTAMPTM